jgi:hypothetical protein
MEDKEILEILRKWAETPERMAELLAYITVIAGSGITPEQLNMMLTKNAILVTVEEKSAELTRVIDQRDEIVRQFNADLSMKVEPINKSIAALQEELTAMRKQASQLL